MKTLRELPRTIPVSRETDVLVCGGGPAGFAAAITAAREGAKVLILERHPFLGGVWTAGALTILIDNERKPGLNAELRRRLRERGASMLVKEEWPEWPIYGLEAMKSLLDDYAEESGIEVQLCTQIVDVHREGDRITGVITESKSGREFVRAKIIIDATGDGDVAAHAGCGFDFGRPGDGKTQPMTLYGRIGGYRGGVVHVEPLLSLARAAGVNPSYERVTVFPQPGQPGVFMLMATHLYGNGLDVRDLTRAELDGRRQIRRLFDIFKRDGGPDWRVAYLIDTGPCVGVREGRRIHGRYQLTEQDLARGARFDDGICEVLFAADIHHQDPSEGGGLYNARTKPYDIPFRSLLPVGVDNLLLAGRCISGDHIAHGSYRVTGNAVATGEAVGVAAALALSTGVSPANVDLVQLKARLKAIRDREPAEQMDTPHKQLLVH